MPTSWLKSNRRLRARRSNQAVGALLVLVLACLFARTSWARPQQNPGDPVQKPSVDPQKPAPQKPEAQKPEAQKPEEQTPIPPINYEVVVTAPRLDIPLKDVPAATSVVPEVTLQTLPRGIAADEAFKLVPGMKVDNQTNGERVHLSIRGQGLLTERGIRGIKVLLDGLPLNDPTGFVPDLFDIDWSTVGRVEVLRGPSSALYGGGAAGGVINVTTTSGSPGVAGGDGDVNVGSFGFYKALAEAGGTEGSLNYRASLSHTAGDGYRVHSAYDATNFYSKLGYTPNTSAKLTAVVAGTSYFNQNPEGLNASQLAEDPTLPNPDALTFNEYQQTDRLTVGLSGQWALTARQDLMFSAYVRHTTWTESVPSTVQHRTYNTPGVLAQYTFHTRRGKYANHFTAGTDVDWQGIDDLKYPNLGDAVEGPNRVADQHIGQSSVGVYALDRIELGPRWGIMMDLRYDQLRNDLFDHLQAGGVDLSGLVKYHKTTGRVGGSFSLSPQASLYASWGQGFTPPTTEELANNPNSVGGLNMSLVPATSQGEEIGARGGIGSQWSYDLTFFHLDTENDFGRYRIPTRPLETFYRNAGSSRRYGVETSVAWYPRLDVAVRAAYTYSDFKYTNIKSLFGEFTDVYMPNAPKNQLYIDAEYTFRKRFVVGLSADLSSGWYIDQTNETSVSGYELVNPRVAYRWRASRYRGEVILTIRNLFNQEWVAFTEPDPDGNSYQPGPTREVFLGARFWLGK
jgi:iron complex outermembrane receptor protein